MLLLLLCFVADLGFFIVKMTKTSAERRNSWKCICTFPLKMKMYIDFNEMLVWKQK